MVLRVTACAALLVLALGITPGTARAKAMPSCTPGDPVVWVNTKSPRIRHMRLHIHRLLDANLL
jgi:hypothetical protein